MYTCYSPWANITHQFWYSSINIAGQTDMKCRLFEVPSLIYSIAVTQFSACENIKTRQFTGNTDWVCLCLCVSVSAAFYATSSVSALVQATKAKQTQWWNLIRENEKWILRWKKKRSNIAVCVRGRERQHLKNLNLSLIRDVFQQITEGSTQWLCIVLEIQMIRYGSHTIHRVCALMSLFLHI